MADSRFLINKPVSKYFSRRGETPEDLINAVLDSPVGAVGVLIRIKDGTTGVIRHITDGITASDLLHGAQYTRYSIPEDVTTTEVTKAMVDIDYLCTEPKWSVGDDQLPFMRIGSWEFLIEGAKSLKGQVDTVFRAISKKLSDGHFVQYIEPDDGRIVSLPLIVIEVPSFSESDGLIKKIKELLETSKGAKGNIHIFDTRSFDREHAIELYKGVFSEAEEASFEESDSFKKLMGECSGCADLAIGIYKTAKRHLGSDGKSTMSFDEAFQDAFPEFEHLFTEAVGR